MAFRTLRKAFGLLKEHPLLWVIGVVAALLAGMEFLLISMGNSFIGGQMILPELILFPFFLGASYGILREGTGDSTYIQEGKRHYFRVLLPGIVIACAAGITAFLVTISVGLIAGGSADLSSFALTSVLVSFIFFTFFYDTAAVFEEKKVFESIRRSIEIVVTMPLKVLTFYLALVLFTFVVFMAVTFVWTTLLADSLEPLTAMTADEMQQYAIQPELFFGLIGESGLLITGVLYSIAALFYIPIVVAWKAAFYLEYAQHVTLPPAAQPTELQGEYDEKGRYYKY